MYTFASHIKNMIHGVQEHYVYKLKVCSGHFPISVKLEKDKFIITNFFGEKIPRTSYIDEGVKVKQEGDIITVEGPDLERVSQTAANFETATKITNRDRRRFQDGIYLIEKRGVKI
jgi:large subunit ribosomal protein L6